MKTIIDKEEFFEEKITSAASDRLFDDYQEHGKQAIETIRDEQPEMYLRIMARHWPDVVRDAIRAHLGKDYSFKERLGRRWTKMRSWLRF